MSTEENKALFRRFMLRVANQGDLECDSSDDAARLLLMQPLGVIASE